MKIKRVIYPTKLEEISDIYNDNIDIFVELDDGITYVFVVTTPENLKWYMDKQGQGYIEAGPPDIIVKSLTKDNIREALENYIKNDGYWIKLLYLVGLGTEVFSSDDIEKMINKFVRIKKYDKN